MPTEPCTPHCPAGDCAGCAFPPLLARCRPSVPCEQAKNCAHRSATLSDRRATIDGTVLKHGNGVWCPIFIDARGSALEAA